MKTFNNLYNQVCDFQNLLQSYRQARKNKSGRDYVIGFEWELEKGLLKIKEELENQTYQFGQYKKFCVFDPKKRLISAARIFVFELNPSFWFIPLNRRSRHLTGLTPFAGVSR